MSWMFAVGCGGGDDDDDVTDAGGKDGTAPTLDATAPGDDDATAPGADAAPDTGIIGTQDSGTKDAAGDSSTPPGSDAGDAGEDAGDAGHDAGVDAGIDAGTDAGALASYRLIGRWSTTATTATASWPGSGIAVSFTGATLILTVTDAANGSFPGGDFLEAYVDGTKIGPITIAAGGTTTIASGLATTGTHTAQIYKMTDANIGAITITNTTTGPGAGTPFTVTNAGVGGGIVAAADPFVHRIEFIGDEQTAGYGDVAACDGVGSAPLTTNQCDETVAYPGLVSRYFNAEHVTTSEYQMGVLGDSGGNPSKAASLLWPLTVPDTTNTAVWTPASFVPEVVVVNLGSITDEAVEASAGFAANYEAGLVSFLTTVYDAYGKKPSFLVVSGPEYTLQDTTDETNFKNDITAAFATFKTNTGATGAVATLNTYSGGCGYYPDGNAHAANATQIEGLLKAAPFSLTVP